MILLQVVWFHSSYHLFPASSFPISPSPSSISSFLLEPNDFLTGNVTVSEIIALNTLMIMSTLCLWCWSCCYQDYWRSISWLVLLENTQCSYQVCLHMSACFLSRCSLSECIYSCLGIILACCVSRSLWGNFSKRLWCF